MHLRGYLVFPVSVCGSERARPAPSSPRSVAPLLHPGLLASPSVVRSGILRTPGSLPHLAPLSGRGTGHGPSLPCPPAPRLSGFCSRASDALRRCVSSFPKGPPGASFRVAAAAWASLAHGSACSPGVGCCLFPRKARWGLDDS